MTRTLPRRNSGPPVLPKVDTVAPLNWTGVRKVNYLLHQTVRYTYPDPVRQVRQELRLVPPPVWGDQVRTGHGVTVTGAPHTYRSRRDQLGNTVMKIEAPLVDHALEFDVWATIERSFDTRRPDRSDRRSERPLDTRSERPVDIWSERPVDTCSEHRFDARSDRRLDARSEHRFDARFEQRWLRPSPLTRPDGAISAAAAALTRGEQPSHALAERICSWVHQHMTYEWGITGVQTSAAEAFRLRVGVCQDYSHVMLALCRLAGLPARYVSGHLIGEGGSHAWVDVAVPDGDGGGRVWTAFDPTHDCKVGPGYLTVAAGRDYADVAPLSGSFHGPGPGTLTVTKRVALIEIT
jgi:transglutaminase-like putative cysteine protease